MVSLYDIVTKLRQIQFIKINRSTITFFGKDSFEFFRYLRYFELLFFASHLKRTFSFAAKIKMIFFEYRSSFMIAVHYLRKRQRRNCFIHKIEFSTKLVLAMQILTDINHPVND